MNLLENERTYLDRQAELLGARDYHVAAAAAETLIGAGSAGLDAAIRSLSHPNARVRRCCAEFMDHHGDDACMEALLQVARHDPTPNVRRAAVHSLSCMRCKPGPIHIDGVGILVERAQADSSIRVRRHAAAGLCGQPPDARAVKALKAILGRETDRDLLRYAHDALQRHDAEYRQTVIEQARIRQHRP